MSKAQKKLVIAVIITFAILALAVVIITTCFSKKPSKPAETAQPGEQQVYYQELNKDKIECYDDAVYFLLVDANISYNNINVQSVRCMQKQPYGQWELNGTYFAQDDRSDGKQFFFHEMRGGMAASGQDTYYEICLIIDNNTVISKIETGRDLNYQGSARCAWQTNLQ